MVERFFERLAAPIRGLHQAAYILALLTLASQALALLRDRTFAHVFGAGQLLDLYYGAFRIPDLVECMSWMPPLNHDPGHLWLRGLVREVARGL